LISTIRRPTHGIAPKCPTSSITTHPAPNAPDTLPNPCDKIANHPLIARKNKPISPPPQEKLVLLERQVTVKPRLTLKAVL
jgi:hypothetical protein